MFPLTQDLDYTGGIIVVWFGWFTIGHRRKTREEQREFDGVIRGLRIARGMTKDEKTRDRLEAGIERRQGYFRLYDSSKLLGE